MSSVPCYIKNLTLRAGSGGAAQKVNVRIYDRSTTAEGEFVDDDLVEELEVTANDPKDRTNYGAGRQGMLFCHYGCYAIVTGLYGELTYNLG
jgi:hypothetical protein|tara:strand:- start:1338 stop:1613 length:276 start_codon:yes stop_codon:yes gene_type:complete